MRYLNLILRTLRSKLMINAFLRYVHSLGIALVGALDIFWWGIIEYWKWLPLKSTKKRPKRLDTVTEMSHRCTNVSIVYGLDTT